MICQAECPHGFVFSNNSCIIQPVWKSSILYNYFYITIKYIVDIYHSHGRMNRIRYKYSLIKRVISKRVDGDEP